MDDIHPSGDDGISVDEMAAMLMQEPESTDTDAVNAAEETPTETDAVEAVEPVEEEQSDEIETEDEEEKFTHVAELAEAAGMELEDFLSSINLTTKVNGQSNDVSLSDLRKGFQLEKDYTRKSQEFAEQRKSFEQETEAARAQLQAEMQKAGQAFAMAQSQLTHDFNSIDWNELQREDPTQFMLKRQQFGERQAQVNLAIEQATQNAQAQQDKQQQEAKAKHGEYLQQQNELLLTAIPDWSDPGKRESGAKEVADYLSSVGFQPDEIGAMSDHRYILLAREAMKGRSVTSDADIAKKKVKAAPKLLKPNAKSQVNANQQRQQKLRNRLRKTGDVDAFSQLLLNGDM